MLLSSGLPSAGSGIYIDYISISCNLTHKVDWCLKLILLLMWILFSGQMFMILVGLGSITNILAEIILDRKSLTHLIYTKMTTAIQMAFRNKPNHAKKKEKVSYFFKQC